MKKRMKMIALGWVLLAQGVTASWAEKGQLPLDSVPGVSREEQLAQSTLAQVESLCKTTRTLDELGKQSLSQSVTVMDLNGEALPVLLQILKNRKKDWRLRYWVTDILGYIRVQDPATKSNLLESLLAVLRNETERKEIRLRAVDSIWEQSKQDKTFTKKMKSELKKTAKKAKEKQISRKLNRLLAGAR